MINKGKSRGQRFCPSQGLNPAPTSSQPVVLPLSYSDIFGQGQKIIFPLIDSG